MNRMSAEEGWGTQGGAEGRRWLASWAEERSLREHRAPKQLQGFTKERPQGTRGQVAPCEAGEVGKIQNTDGLVCTSSEFKVSLDT